MIAVFSCVMFTQMVQLQAQSPEGTKSAATKWPTRGWAKAAPASVGVDEKRLAALDADLASGKYALVDSFAVFRCGSDVFLRTDCNDFMAALFGDFRDNRSGFSLA